jgi:hypothetical protein
MTCQFRVELERAPCRNFAKPCYGLHSRLPTVLEISVD